MALATLIVNGPSAVNVEKEKLYWVRSNAGNSLISKNSKGTVLDSCGRSTTYQIEHKEFYTFTEKEIKDFDERYWAFAKPVEVDE